MGAQTTKRHNQTKEENQLGKLAKRRLKITEKLRRSKPGKEGDQLNFQRKEELKMKKKSLQELHMKPPPGFRKFESEVDWQNMDEHIAVQLWEDVFKPLYTFYEVRRISNPS